MVMSPKEAQKRLEHQYKRQNEHIKANYDRISLTLPKGTKDRIKAQGQSVNGFVNNLVLAELDRLEQVQKPGSATNPLDRFNF